MPIKPRGERGNKWLRYFFAIAMLAVVVGGSAFLVTRLFGDDGDGGNGQDTELAAVPTAQTTAGAGGDEPTPTPEPEGDGPTPTPEQAEPTPTTQPAVAAQPTQQSQQAAPTSAAGDSTSGEQQSTSASTAEELLPTTDEIEGSWTIATEGERTREEVGAQLGDGGEQLLLDWRWRENQFRDFNRDDPESFSDDATFLSVSVHRFASEEGAAEALVYLSDIVVSAQGLQEVADVGIGDVSRGLEGPGDGVNLYVLYVQDGNYLIRLGGSSTAGDPAPFVDSVARQILEN